jgi:hypothetical protein
MIQPLVTLPLRGIALALSAALLAAGTPAPAVAANAEEYGDRTSYVLFAPGSTSANMSGSMEDIRRAKGLRSGREAMLYVRDGRGEWVIRDPETLRRARAIFEPQEALGARQAELGSRQAELGSRQAALGAQQARVGARQASSPRRAAQFSGEMHALGRQQSALGEQQAALGRQQAELGAQQARLAREAQSKFRALLADAMRRGVAQRVE